MLLNRSGYDDIESILEEANKPLKPDTFEDAATRTGAVVLDVRSADDFSKSHIPNSIFIGIDGGFAPWVGTLIGNTKHPILFVAPEGREEETITRLSRVGFDNTLGYLEGGINAWIKRGKAVEQIENISAYELKTQFENGATIFDVRQESEFNSTHIPNVTLVPLDEINQHLNRFDNDKPFFLHCAGGYRSMIALSILKNRGIHTGVNVVGGMKSIKETDIHLHQPSC